MKTQLCRLANNLQSKGYIKEAQTIRKLAESILDAFLWNNPVQYADDSNIDPWYVEIRLPGTGTHFELNNQEYRNYYSIQKGEHNALEFAKEVSQLIPYPVWVGAMARIRAIFENGSIKSEKPTLHEFYSNITPEQEAAWKSGDAIPKTPD